MLQAPRISHEGPHKERHVNPYEVPAGAVPQTVTGKVTGVRPSRRSAIQRSLTPAELAQQKEIRALSKARSARYNHYLDLLIQHEGNRAKALSEIFGIEESEATVRMMELQDEVHLGRGGSEVGEIMERNDLTMAARMNILRRWAYADNAAASINAIKLLQEAEGGGANEGSFEAFLRIAKSSA